MAVNFDDARVFDAAGIFAIHAGRENGLARTALEGEAVFARGEAKADDMLRIVAGGTVEQIKSALIVNRAGIANDETFPRLLGVRREDGIVQIFFEFHKVKAVCDKW